MRVGWSEGGVELDLHYRTPWLAQSICSHISLTRPGTFHPPPNIPHKTEGGGGGGGGGRRDGRLYRCRPFDKIHHVQSSSWSHLFDVVQSLFSTFQRYLVGLFDQLICKLNDIIVVCS